MLYQTTEAPVRTSLDVAGTPSENAGRYDDPNATLRLNGQGLPVAVCRVISIGQPGSFASQRYQVVRPDGIVSLFHSSLKAWDAHPVN